MARIHTDFIVMSKADYSWLLNVIANHKLFDCDVIKDVPVNLHSSLESSLYHEGKCFLKKTYVK